MTHSKRRQRTDWLSCALLPRRRQALTFLSMQPMDSPLAMAMKRHQKFGSLWSKTLASRDFAKRCAAETSQLDSCQGWWLCPDDKLENLVDLPMGVLRGRGRMPKGCRIGIVGARRADSYGRRIARRLASRVAEIGGVVVSGGAYGIDIASHRGSLEAGGKTVVVLGSGLSYPTPSAHVSTFNDVLDHGAVVSPFACRQRAARWTFLERNAWIAALSDHLIVVQASERSGALHTAQAAMERRRPIWVVPGSYDDPLHIGCHSLVEKGAHLMTSQTVWGPSGPQVGPAPSKPNLSRAKTPPKHTEVWEAVGTGVGSLTELADLLTIPLDELVSAVTELEMTGWLRRQLDGSMSREWPTV